MYLLRGKPTETLAVFTEFDAATSAKNTLLASSALNGIIFYDGWTVHSRDLEIVRVDEWQDRLVGK